MNTNEFSRQVSNNLDIGDALKRDFSSVPKAATFMVLESIGKDLLVFISFGLVTLICASIGIIPYQKIYWPVSYWVCWVCTDYTFLAIQR